MSLTEQLQADMKTAMRDGDTIRRDTLRMAMAAAQNAAKDKRAPLTDEEAIEVIGREVKKRRESIVAYSERRPGRPGGRRAVRDRHPDPLPSRAARAMPRCAPSRARPCSTTGATSPRDMGRVMGQLMPRVKGRADGKVVSAIVNEELARAAGA